KVAFFVSSPDTRRKLLTQLPARKCECYTLYQKTFNKCAPGRLLTIAAILFKHLDWLSGLFVTNRAAIAAASERCFHLHFLVFCYSLVEKVLSNPVSVS